MVTRAIAFFEVELVSPAASKPEHREAMEVVLNNALDQAQIGMRIFRNARLIMVVPASEGGGAHAT